MTAKAKAKELVEKFKQVNEDYIDRYQSIPCALIAVDELILYAKDWDDAAYWEEVKQEIEKL